MPGGKEQRVPQRYMRAEFGRPGPRILDRNRPIRPNPRGRLIPVHDIGFLIDQYAPPILQRNLDFVVNHGDLREQDILNGFDHQLVLLRDHTLQQDAIIVQRLKDEEDDYKRWKEARDARLAAEAEAEPEENKEKE